MDDINKYIILFIALCVLVIDATEDDPMVQSDFGPIRGLWSADGEYSMFMGIPYATVNETNPFGASIPHAGFNEVFEAIDDSAMCPQLGVNMGSLDCLHLHVYVPANATSSNLLPVLVWIHGGGLISGSARRYLYGPKFLVRHGIILVSINYRLGPYGFMCLDTPDVPGNQGLKDQKLALKWIKNHIRSFGGDADKITIYGESAGGLSVDAHLFYDEDNLFSQAIVYSGSAMSPGRTTGESDLSNPVRLAQYLGSNASDPGEAITFLATVDSRLVITASVALGLTYPMCVEKVFDGVESFMTVHPFNKDLQRNIPIIVGYNSNETLAEMLSVDAVQNRFNDYLSNNFNFEQDQIVQLEKIVRNFYIGDEVINEQTLVSMAMFVSDFIYNHPVQRSVQKYLDYGAERVYQVMFSYYGERNVLQNYLNIYTGVAMHADELGYLFDVSYLTNEPTPEDQRIIDQITTLWANFVKYGNPTLETSELLPVTWQPVTADTLYYLNIDSELSLQRRPFHDRMTFWDLFYEMNRSFQNGYIENK